MLFNNELSSIFDEAIKIEAIEERVQFLDVVCKDNRELKTRLNQLLEAYENCQSCLNEPAELDELVKRNTAVGWFRSIDEDSLLEQVGNSVGPFKLTKKIGSGGFGVVFEARQESPIRRDVAVKLIKPGMDTKEVLSRFRLERQALAIMDHVCIAKLFDAGATSSGRPYFAMELVDGEEITKFCERNQLAIKQRVELMIQVCNGVQHAHQKGVIHRDIKPSNVLVVVGEETATPKLIDFGVAKALDWQAPGLQTSIHQKIGTPLYMSPEQALGSKDIDARSDIFALGAVLFELVTGTTHISREDLKDKKSDEIFELIGNGNAPVPSRRIESGFSSIQAKSFGCNKSSLLRQVKGELDWIISKALHTDPEFRYATANELSKDLTRYLNDEVVDAARPSKSYRLKKFVVRYQSAVAIGLGVAALLIASSVVSVWFGVNSYRNEQLAEKSKTKAIESEKSERQAKNEAVLEAEKYRSLFSEFSSLIGIATELEESQRQGKLENFVESLLTKDKFADSKT